MRHAQKSPALQAAHDKSGKTRCPLDFHDHILDRARLPPPLLDTAFIICNECEGSKSGFLSNYVEKENKQAVSSPGGKTFQNSLARLYKQRIPHPAQSIGKAI
ncbi:MAG: hypothetical protein UGF45_03810 [Massilioclostridium sp.]|nr:hypothetical protein [Massilioclostridium sp.]